MLFAVLRRPAEDFVRYFNSGLASPTARLNSSARDTVARPGTPVSLGTQSRVEPPVVSRRPERSHTSPATQTQAILANAQAPTPPTQHDLQLSQPIGSQNLLVQGVQLERIQLTDSDEPIAERSSTPHETRTVIKTSMTVSVVFQHLLDHRCTDITPKLEYLDPSTAAYAGGRFGDVWRSRTKGGTEVAIKCLRLYTADEASVKAVKRATRELYYWSKARHENVLELMGISQFNGRLSMVSPWMLNGDLRQYTRTHPEANRWKLVSECLEISKGLAYIHEIGMVHGDLKAMNVMVSDDGIAKLADFGNAFLEECSLGFSVSTTTFVGGSLRWMAPELLSIDGGPAVDRNPATDVYSLGMTILEVITGDMPYSEHNNNQSVVVAMSKKILPSRPEELSGRENIGEQCWALLLTCWNHDSSGRPTSEVVRDEVGELCEMSVRATT